MTRRMTTILVVITFVAAGISLFDIRSDTAEPIKCVSVEERERIRTVVIEGIDKALKQHVQKLFDIWMKDTSKQPERAIEGMEIGISAHVRARTNALNWNPPPC